MRPWVGACVAILALASVTGVTPPAAAAGTRFLTLPFPSTKGMHIQRAWGIFDGVLHHGIDYIHGAPGAPSTWKGFPVIAAAPGLACAQRAGRRGCIELPDEKLTDRVLIRHRVGGRTYYTLYQHVARIAPGIPIGSRGRTVRVKRGQPIGRTGADEGAASLIHLHFELLDAHLKPIDPYQIRRTSAFYPDPAGRNHLRAKPGHFWLDNPPRPPERVGLHGRPTGTPSPTATPSSPAPTTSATEPLPTPNACGPPVASPSASTSPGPSASASAGSPALPSPVSPAEVPPSPSIGTPWTLTLMGDGGSTCSLDGVVAWTGGFVAMDLQGPRPVSVWTSTDGTSWQRHAAHVPGGDGRSVQMGAMVAYGDGLLLFGSRRGRLLVWRSSDATHWVRLPPSRVFRSGARHIAFQVAVSGPRILVMGATEVGCEVVWCPDEPIAWTSRDGEHWHRVVPAAADRGGPEPSLLADVLGPGPGGFLTLGPDGSILGSRTGARWRPIGVLPEGVDPDRMVAYRAADGYTYLVDEVSAARPADIVVRRSSDLRSWSEVYRTPYQGWIPLVWAVADGGIVVSGYDQGEFVWALSSPDGVTWDLSAGWPDMAYGDVTGTAVGDDRMVLVAAGQNSGGNIAWAKEVPPGP